MTNDHASINALFGQALRDTADIVNKKALLFRLEIMASLRSFFAGLAMMLGAAIFAIVALTLLTQSLVEWLAVQLRSASLASLIVAIGMAGIAAILFLAARRLMSASSLTPKKTVESLRRDGEVFSDKVTA